ncbi:hypothetical protein DYB35_001167 [Aphanomyces astaci]|uniref:Uncharacterized protein n=2 Tax=Aphanomyces astaci TaxID=112090 RepID=A0A418DF94_APHAT|nr:hypothetical protein DYB35_001167 [Aphanomyces astaci]
MGIAEEEAELSREMVQFLTSDVISQLRTTQSQLEDAERRWSRMETQEEATGKSMKAKVKIDVWHYCVLDCSKANMHMFRVISLHQACVLDQLLEFHRALQLQYRRMENVVRLLEKQVSSIQDAGDGRLLQHTSSLVAQVVTVSSLVEIVKQTSVAVDLPGLDDMLTTVDAQVARLLHVRDQGDALMQCGVVASS